MLSTAKKQAGVELIGNRTCQQLDANLFEFGGPDLFKPET